MKNTAARTIEGYRTIDNFVYLGATFTKDNKEITKSRGGSCLTTKNPTWYSQFKKKNKRKEHRKTMLTIYETLIRPLLYDGSDPWTPRGEQKINAFARGSSGSVRVDGGWRM